MVVSRLKKTYSNPSPYSPSTKFSAPKYLPYQLGNTGCRTRDNAPATAVENSYKTGFEKTLD